MAQSARLSAIAFTVAQTGLHYGYDWVPTMLLYSEQLKLRFLKLYFSLLIAQTRLLLLKDVSPNNRCC